MLRKAITYLLVLVYLANIGCANFASPSSGCRTGSGA
jgi:hypothetical protein